MSKLFVDGNSFKQYHCPICGNYLVYKACDSTFYCFTCNKMFKASDIVGED